jgi:hypothetical protein
MCASVSYLVLLARCILKSYVDGVCGAFRSGREGDSCSVTPKLYGLESCGIGLSCTGFPYATCQKVEGQLCQRNSDCTLDPSPSRLCSCDASREKDLDPLGAAVCTTKRATGPSDNFLSQMDDCLKEVGLSALPFTQDMNRNFSWEYN